MTDTPILAINAEPAEQSLRELVAAIVNTRTEFRELLQTFRNTKGISGKTEDDLMALTAEMNRQMKVVNTFKRAYREFERSRQAEMQQSMKAARDLNRQMEQTQARRRRFARSNEGRAQISEGRASISWSRQEELTNRLAATRARLREAEEKAVGEITQEVKELFAAEKALVIELEAEKKARQALLDLQKRMDAAQKRVNQAQNTVGLARNTEERLRSVVRLKEREIELERQRGNGEETARLRRLERSYNEVRNNLDRYLDKQKESARAEQAANATTRSRIKEVERLTAKMALLDLQVEATQNDPSRRRALEIEREELRLKQLQLRTENEQSEELKEQIRLTEQLIRRQRDQAFVDSTRQQANRRSLIARDPALLQQTVGASAAIGNAAWRERLSGEFSGDTFRMQGRLMANFMVLNGLMEAFRFSMRFVVEFDRALFDLQAITASTDTEMQQFRASIVEVANSTKFTAVEVAEAAKVLGQAGFTVREVGQALDGVARFASATGITIQEGVDLMSSAISVFGRRAEEATDLANLFTAALNTSKLTQDRLSQSFSYVANTASQSGVAIEELTAVLAGLANAGIRSGSTIGTNLRAMMIALQSPTQEMIDKFSSMGVSMREVDLSTNGIIGVIENLADAGFTAADAFEVFEVRAANAFVSLQGQRGSLRSIERDIQGTNAAVDASDTQMRSLANTFANFQSVFGSMVQEAFEPMTRALQMMLEAVNTVLSGFQELDLVVAGLGVVLTSVALTKLVSFTREIVRKSAAVKADTLATNENTAAVNANAAANTRGAVAAGRAATAATLAGRAFQFLGGWVGIAIGLGTAAVAVVTALANSHKTLAERVDEAQAALSEASGAFDEQTEIIQALNDEILRMVQQERSLRDNTEDLESTTRTMQDRFRSLGLTLTDVAGDYDALLSRMKEFRQEQSRVSANLAEAQAISARNLVDATEANIRNEGISLIDGENGSNTRTLIDLGRRFDALDNVATTLYNRGIPQTVEVTRALEQMLSSVAREDRSEEFNEVVTALTSLEQTLVARDRQLREASDFERLSDLSRAGGEAEGRFFTNVLEAQGTVNSVRDLLESAALTQSPELQAKVLGSGISVEELRNLPDLSGNARAGLEEALNNLPDELVEDGFIQPLSEFFTGMEDALADEYRQLPEAAKELARENDVLGIVDRLWGTLTGVISSVEERAAEAGASSFNLDLSRSRRDLGRARQRLEDTRNDSEFAAAAPVFRSAVNAEARARVSQRLNTDFNFNRDQVSRILGQVTDEQLSQPAQLARAIVEAAEELDIDLNADRRNQLINIAEEAGAQTADRLEALVTQAAKITDTERRVSLQTQQREIQQLRAERDQGLSDWPEGLELTRAMEAFANAEVQLRDIHAREMARLNTELTAREIVGAEREARLAELEMQQETERTEQARIQQQTLFRLWDGVQQRELNRLRFEEQELRNPRVDFGDQRESRDEVDERYSQIFSLMDQSLEIERNRLRRALELNQISEQYFDEEMARLDREAAAAREETEQNQDEERREGRITSFSQLGDALHDRIGSNNPEYFDSINNSMETLADTTLNSLVAGLQTAQGAFQNFFTDITSGTMSVQDAFQGMAVGILQAMQQVITSKIAEMMMELVMSLIPGGAGGGGGFGSFLSGLFGGKRKASGGKIHGPVGTRDSEMILAQPGEYVLRKSAAESIGYDELNKMNAMGNRAIGGARPKMMQPQPMKNDTVNVYAVLPEEKPVPGPRDIVAVIADDMRKGGTTKKLIKSINTGAL